ncbi:MAG: PKD domain-containing protein [Thermoplasmata archaeon]|nr:PKD domain-containing protein [Thermoplasmata archaeon]
MVPRRRRPVGLDSALACALLVVLSITGSVAAPLRPVASDLRAPPAAPGSGVPFAGSPPVNLQISNTDPQPAGEPTLGVNRYGTIVADWEMQGQLQNPVGPVSMAFSNDSGSTFGENITIQTSPASSFEYDVSTSFLSPNGTVWVGYGASPGDCSGGFTSSTMVTAVWDNGSRWSSPIAAIPCSKTGGGFLDREWGASTPNGTVFEAVDDGNGNVWMSRAFNGLNFSTPKTIFSQNQITIAAFSYNDSLWGVGDLSNTGCQILYSKDGGSHWSAAKALPSGCAASGISWAAVFGRNARIALTYVDAKGTEFVRSTDLGSHWSKPVLLSGTVPSGTSFLTPAIASDPATGGIGVVWLDTRGGVSAFNWNVFESDSTNDGLNWSVPRLLSDQIAGSGSGFWPGDFIGNTITPWGTDAAVWGGDDSTGDLQTYFAQLPLVNASAGNLTVVVQNGSGVPQLGSHVGLDGRPARTNASGEVTYYGLAPGSYSVNVSAPPLGNGSANATVSAGATNVVVLKIGPGPKPSPLVSRIAIAPSHGVVPLKVEVSATPSGGTPPYRITWSWGDGSSEVHGSNASYTYEYIGEYYVTSWTNDSANQSVENSTAIVVEFPIQPLVVHDAVDVTHGTLPLDVNFTAWASGGLQPVNYTWDFGDGYGLNRTGVANASHVYLNAGNFTARLWVNDSRSPPAQFADSFRIEVNPKPVIVPLPPVWVVVAGSTVQPLEGQAVWFNATISGGTGVYSTPQWDWGDGSFGATIAGPAEHAFDVTGNFTVTVRVNDSAGRWANGTFNVSVRPLGPFPPGGTRPPGTLPPVVLIASGAAIAAVVAAGVIWGRRHPPAPQP